MKKITLMTAIALMPFGTFLSGVENQEIKHSSSKRCRTVCRTPSGSYYVDSTSQDPLQRVLSTGTLPETAPVHFSGTNLNADVTLSLDGNSIVVPKRGYYEIDWNATLSLIQGAGDPPSNTVNYHFNLQKNGVTLLHPIPQVLGLIRTNGIGDIPFTSAAASVIIPLEANDTISLLLTIDGSEGNHVGDGVQIEGAQISAHFVSPVCNEIF